MDLDALKTSLGCGTQCGSCVPELRRMLGSAAQPA
jgi:assimilatory nitrate reductase catalytic subunit